MVLSLPSRLTVNECVASESKRRRRMLSHSRVISELLHLGQVEHWSISVDKSGDVGLTLVPGARQPGVFNGLAV
ncbi:hypothetical protein ALC53_12401 [Atta colombica]|uniref:Uncharacterized protein n=1 Tax=Atta colombica TaxID=520822 RepID=A0A195AY26_9HYME|nr:hypothetical protein ALC53_12401 [Atta colombica]